MAKRTDPEDQGRRSADDGYIVGPTAGGPDVQLTRRSRSALRSDDWIKEQIQRRLDASSLAGSPVEVHVRHGDVILRGHVGGAAARHLAEQIATSIAGVHDVRLEPHPAAPDTPSGGEDECPHD